MDTSVSISPAMLEFNEDLMEGRFVCNSLEDYLLEGQRRGIFPRVIDEAARQVIASAYYRIQALRSRSR